VTAPAGAAVLAFFLTTTAFVPDAFRAEGDFAAASACGVAGPGPPSTSSEKRNPSTRTTTPALRTSASGRTVRAG